MKASVLLLALGLSPAFGSPGLDIPRLSQPPVIDGALDDPAWKEAAKVTELTQFEPKEGRPMTEPTTALIGYDSDNLYLAFHALDADPGGVRAHLSPRDQFFGDDWVALIIDPYGDQHRAFEFIANPLGVQLDAVNKDGNEDGAQDFVWYSEGRLTADGYTVELRIPLKTLRFSKQPLQRWRFMVLRNIERKNEKAAWPPIRGDGGTLQAQMGDMRGVAGVEPGKRVEFIPELTGSQAAPYESETNAMHAGNSNARLGGNLKYGLTPDWTLDSTYNPDFSQIEADQPQVQVNQRFPLFFAEKRPFFMEGADLFSTPIRLVHTRTMVDPEYGLKVTGQEGRLSAGLLRARDRSQGGSVFDVARLNAAVGAGSSLGALYSDRELGDGLFNRVGGVDGLTRIDKLYSFGFQAADSASRKKGAQYISGGAYRASFSRDARNLSFSAVYTDLSPNFRADSGFINRVDVRDTSLEVSYKHFPSSGPFLSFRTGLNYDRAYDHKGFLTDEAPSLHLSAHLPLQTGAFVRVEPATLERFGGVDFHKRRVDLGVRSEPRAFLSASLGGGLGDGVDYAAAVPFLGDETDLDASVTLKPGSRLSFEQLYIRSRLDKKGGGRVYDDNIWREKAAFQWTRRLSNRAIYQYDTLSHAGFADFLVSYVVTPGTAFYLGYDWSFKRKDSALQTTRRLVFAKASYLFRL